jgi:hypothetical protein
MSNEIELELCPFCGGMPVYEETITERSVTCDNCSAKIVRDIGTVLPQYVWNGRVTVRSDEPTDAELEKLGNRAMDFLVARYGHPQLDKFVNWEARPEALAMEMAEFTYRLQSQPETPVTARPDAIKLQNWVKDIPNMRKENQDAERITGEDLNKIITARPDDELKDARQLETEITELKEIVTAPIDMIIFCPSCHKQHIDRPDPECRKPDHLGPDGDEPCRRSKGHTGQCMCSPMDEDVVRWTNPAHKSHTCRSDDGGCGIIFRVADVPTNGVKNIQTKGENDTWAIHVQRSGD